MNRESYCIIEVIKYLNDFKKLALLQGLPADRLYGSP